MHMKQEVDFFFFFSSQLTSSAQQQVGEGLV